MMLKLGSNSVIPVLCKIFRLSLSQGKLPMSWKRANIAPVFKSGDKALFTNYRPIALTSVVCKVLERIITNAIQTHVNDYCLPSY